MLWLCDRPGELWLKKSCFTRMFRRDNPAGRNNNQFYSVTDAGFGMTLNNHLLEPATCYMAHRVNPKFAASRFSLNRFTAPHLSAIFGILAERGRFTRRISWVDCAFW